MMTINLGSGSFYKIGFFVVAGLLLFIGGVYSAKLFQEKSQTANFPPTIVPSPTLSPSPTVVKKTDEQGIKEAFSQKYNRPVSEVSITISKNNGIYAQGGVKFAGEMGGGWFLSYKEETGWIIVDDGNGTISCEKIAPYNFPKEFVPECVDKSGKLIKKK